MGSKVPMVLRDKEVERVTDSKAPTVVKAKQVEAMEDGVKARMTAYQINTGTTLMFYGV